MDQPLRREVACRSSVKEDELEPPFPGIGPCMGYDVDSNISPPSGKHAVEYAESSYYDDVLPALISVSYAEDDALKHHCNGDAAGQGMELLLEITAEGDLFAETRRQAKKNPEGNFDR
jgi:hypothetical protein